MKKRYYAFLLLIMIASPALSLPIDITEQEIYLRKGFNTSWTKALPVSEKWHLIKGIKGNRPLRMRDLTLKNPGYFTPFLPLKTQSFTLVTSFNLRVKPEETYDLGLFLAQIGLNWEIFINGKSIRKEIFLRKDGSIKEERAVRNHLVHIKKQFINYGKNILAIHIIGDPSDDRTGLFMTKGYIIDNYTNLIQKSSDRIELMFIAVYIFVALTYLIIYLHRREDSFYLFFGSAIIMISIYLFSRSTTVYELIHDTETIKAFEYFGSFTGLAFFLTALSRLLHERYSIVVKIYFVINITMAILQFFIFRNHLLHLWYFIMPIGVVYIFIFDIILPLKKIISEEFKIRSNTNPFSVIWSVLLSSLQGKLLLGVLAVLISSILDIIYMHRGFAANYSLFSFSAIVIGSSLIIASDLVKLYKVSEEMNLLLEERVNRRTRDLLFSEIGQSLYSEVITEISDSGKNTTSLDDSTKKSIVLLSQDPGVLEDINSLVSGLGEKLMAIFSAEGLSLVLETPGFKTIDLYKGNFSDDDISLSNYSHFFKDGDLYHISKKSSELYIVIKLQGYQSGICKLIRNSSPFTAVDGELAAGFMKQSSHVISNALMYQGLINNAQKKRKKKLAQNTEDKVEKSIEYIKSNYRYDISREGLAAHLNINTDNLGKAFKIITGKKINDFINELRINDAAEQLKTTNDKIIDIAYNVGFESLATFNRIFQKLMHASPSEYRKIHS